MGVVTALGCLHKYFDLVHAVSTTPNMMDNSDELSASSADLTSAIDVMWDIAIEAEQKNVAESCGVFVTWFYMKPKLRSNGTKGSNVDAMSANVADSLTSALIASSTGAAFDHTSTNLTKYSSFGDKWDQREVFIRKCTDYLITTRDNEKYVKRVLDLLETFIECTRPGIMTGTSDLNTKLSNNNGNAFDDLSSSSSVQIVGSTNPSMGDLSGTNSASIENILKLTVNPLKPDQWDLGKYKIDRWQLPIGRDTFIRLIIAQFSMKDQQPTTIMVSKHATVGELQELVCAMLNQPKDQVVNMTADNNVTLGASNARSTLSTLDFRDGTTITVMTFVTSTQVPDGSYILSQNKDFIDILKVLLNNGGELSCRVWNLLMRLPFNHPMMMEMKEITTFIHEEQRLEQHTGRMRTYRSALQMNWDNLIHSDNQFGLLYDLIIFDAVLSHARSDWTSAFSLLNGFEHFFNIILRFEFKYDDPVFTFASYRTLFMLLKIFASLTAHGLSLNDPEFVRAKPRHNVPLCIKTRRMGNVRTFFQTSDIPAFGEKLLDLVLSVADSMEKEDTSMSNSMLISEIIELGLYQFICLMLAFPGNLRPLFEKGGGSQYFDPDEMNEEMMFGGMHMPDVRSQMRYEEQRRLRQQREHEQQVQQQNNQDIPSKWHLLLNALLFSKDIFIRRVSVKYLYIIYAKYSSRSSVREEIDATTFELLHEKLTVFRDKSNENHYRCKEYFEFFGHFVAYYGNSIIIQHNDEYYRALMTFSKIFVDTFDSLSSYITDETVKHGDTDQYLCGVLKLLKTILRVFPRLKQHEPTKIAELKMFLLNDCLLKTLPANTGADSDTESESETDMKENNDKENEEMEIVPIDMFLEKKEPEYPKCKTQPCRVQAFDLLLELCKDNWPLWNQVLGDVISCHRDYLEKVAEEFVDFGFDPGYSERSNTGFVGLYNYRCTCYLNATLQQLYMNPIIRKVILNTDLRKIFKKPDDNDDGGEAKADNDDAASTNGDNNNGNKEDPLKNSVCLSLQEMFSHLTWSKRRCYRPDSFVSNYRDFEGKKIDVHEQMDAHEFLNYLFDHIEREMKGCIAEKILKSEFCGRQVNQVICQECGYKSETFEPIYAVGAKIEGYDKLEDSLENEYVKGEWLKGGNAYRCSKCDKKVTALKRSCFVHLPNTMIVHLKRFKWNLENMTRLKINARLQFPTHLSMTKYTKQYLDYKEEKEKGFSSPKSKDDNSGTNRSSVEPKIVGSNTGATSKGDSNSESTDIGYEKYDYELVGITVHQGVADAGHYYSYIREQNNEGELGDWFHFDDDRVSFFNQRNIPDQCYGGQRQQRMRDYKTQEWVHRWVPKENNAYMLFYRKKGEYCRKENINIGDEYLTRDDVELTLLKKNGGKLDVDMKNDNNQKPDDDMDIENSTSKQKNVCECITCQTATFF